MTTLRHGRTKLKIVDLCYPGSALDTRTFLLLPVVLVRWYVLSDAFFSCRFAVYYDKLLYSMQLVCHSTIFRTRLAV